MKLSELKSKENIQFLPTVNRKLLYSQLPGNVPKKGAKPRQSRCKHDIGFANESIRDLCGEMVY